LSIVQYLQVDAIMVLATFRVATRATKTLSARDVFAVRRTIARRLLCGARWVVRYSGRQRCGARGLRCGWRRGAAIDETRECVGHNRAGRRRKQSMWSVVAVCRSDFKTLVVALQVFSLLEHH